MLSRSSALRANEEVLRRTNSEISLYSSRFSESLLSGVFRSIFRIEKGYELSESEVFTLDHDPDRIEWRRLDAHQIEQLGLSILLEDVRASRYQSFMEYDFVATVDVSQSMMGDWWPIYRGEASNVEAARQRLSRKSLRSLGDRTKLWLLKYALVSCLRAAHRNGFRSHVLLTGGDRVTMLDSRRDPHLHETVLGYIDDRFADLARNCRREKSKLEQSLWLVVARLRRAVVLTITDFLDCRRLIQHEVVGRPAELGAPQVSMSHVMAALGTIASRHRNVVIQINDRDELWPRLETRTRRHTKEGPNLDTESFVDATYVSCGRELMRQYVIESNAWFHSLSSRLARLGIPFDQVVAGRDDLHFDKRLYSLGARTGRR